LLIAALLVFGGLYREAWTASRPRRFAPASVPAPPASAEAPRYEAQLLPNTSARFVHSPTAAEISAGGLRAFWYGGSHEGSTDVAIYTSVYSPQSARWTRERVVITRALAQRQLRRYVRKLGNPVVGRDHRGRLWLYFVSTSLGGWASSAINAMVSEDDGASWSPPRRLITSPFFNLSTLIKGASFLFADGSVGLPAYHELLGKFAELLRLDGDGNVVAKTRLTWGRSSLQPEIVPRSSSDAVAFLRYAGDPPKRMLAMQTGDGGAHWSSAAKTALANPDAGISCAALADGSLLLAFNDSETNRETLALALSPDFGSTWRVIHRLEGDRDAAQTAVDDYSYPWILQDRAGDVHVLYAWGHRYIKHVRFNPAWRAERD
jgi:predicted neuraminidase